MKKFFKWVGISLGSVIIIAVIAIGIIIMTFNHRLSKTYAISVESVKIPDDSISYEKGKRLASIHCVGCHGDELQGMMMLKADAIGQINSANLTRGQGSATRNYQNKDWVRSIRHGVNPKGRPLLVMPAAEFYYLTDEDLGSIIAYLKRLSPVNNIPEQNRLTVLAKILMTMGAFGKVISVEWINHDGPRPAAPEVAVTEHYGHYMVQTSGCYVCHGVKLNGGKDPNPNAPPVPNITMTGQFGKWTEEQFMSVLRTGRTPEGKQLSIYMPWKDFGKMNDLELRAIYKYLRSLKG